MVQDNNLPIVGVIGSTGKQGHSVVKALVESGEYRVRGLTRSPGTNKAMEYVKYYTGMSQEKKHLLESELVHFDASKENTYEKAFEGLTYLFAMTDAHKTDDWSQEYEWGKRIADYSKKAGIKHVVWSSLPNVEKITKGKLNVPHFTNKAKVEEYMKEIDLPYTAVVPGFFMSNLTELEMFKIVQHDDKKKVVLPVSADTKLPVCDASSEVGPAVLKILKHRDQMVGKESPIYSEELTVKEIVYQLDQDAVFEQINGEDLLKRDYNDRQPKITDEYINMFMFFDQYGYFGGLRSSAGAKAGGAKAGAKVKEFLERNKAKVQQH